MAIINSLIHRDLKNPKSNEVAIYKDRVEIFNPGEFSEGFEPEDFIKGQGSIPRNPLIANTLYLSKDIEKWGSGFRRITEACQKSNTKVKFEMRKNGFMVIFYRKSDKELLDLTGENKNTHEKTYENIEEKVLEFCIQERTAKEIAEYCGYKGVDRFKRNYLKALLEQEKIKMTIPDKPKSKNQKYISSK